MYINITMGHKNNIYLIKKHYNLELCCVEYTTLDVEKEFEEKTEKITNKKKLEKYTVLRMSQKDIR